MVSVSVSAVGRPIALAKDLPTTLEFPGKTTENVTISDLKQALAVKFPKFYPSRQKLALKGERKALTDEATLKDAGIADGDELSAKDLGPQASWTTVFVVEYIGPLIIHPLVYHFPNIFYGGPVQHSLLQRYVYAMVMLHFLKREYETLFVHRFSHGTMPFAYIFRNSAHYHILGGIALAYSVYSPTYSVISPYIRGTVRNDPIFLWGCIAFWIFAEFSNLRSHITLRNLRPAGTKTRAIPYGYGFSFVSCPNYFFEILGWLVVSIMTGSYAAYIFLIAGTYMQAVWAIKKHRNYKKEFGNKYPKNRKAIFPFLL